jgi:hypothetical protein
MKRLTGVLFSLLFLAAVSSQAQYLSYNDYLDEVADIANKIQLGQEMSYKIGGTTVADSCTVFLSKEMFLGDAGRDIFDTIKNKKASFPELMKGGSLSKYCSKYPRMQDDQKAMVWVMVLTMMAHFESSCSIKAKAKGPNGTAKGYYQLHSGKEQNYDGELDLCVKNASGNEKLSSKCALGMLERQLGKDNGQLFSPKSYWDVLRPAGEAKKADDIQRTLKKSSLCNPVTT